VTEVYIDLVTPAGLVEGWARSASQDNPLVLTVWLDGAWVGAAVACAFRRDLLDAGIGHGHFSYRCKIRRRQADHGYLEIRDAGGNATLASYAIEPNGLVPNRKGKRRAIESLLVEPAKWSMTDIEDHLEALDLETSLMELGPKRFIAMAYRFLLGRWPGPREYDSYLPEMRRDRLSATDIFRAILNSDERKNKGRDPLSPFDPGYPLRGRGNMFQFPAPSKFGLQDRGPADMSTVPLISAP